MTELTNEVKSAPSYKEVKSLLVRYGEIWKKKLSAKQNSSVNEIGRRLDRLDKLARSLVSINNELIKRDPLNTEIQLENDTLIIDFGGEKKAIKFKRKDPDKPIEMVGGTTVFGYSANDTKSKGSDETASLLKEELEEKLESYYQNAHRVLTMAKYLPGITNLKCDAITIVRNKLIEHTEERHIYSFGYGSGGPVVKPSNPTGAPTFHDRGLIENTKALIDAFTKKLQCAIDNA